MGGELSFFLVVLALLLVAHWLEAQDFPALGSAACRALMHAVYCELKRLTPFLVPSKIRLPTDADDGSNRSSNGEGTSFRGRRREEGNVLAVLLGAVVIFALIGGSLFEIGNAARQRSLQTQYRDRAVASTEFSVEAIRRAAIQQLQQQAWLDVASLDLNQTQAQGSKETGYYNLDLQAQAAGPQIFATQTHVAFQSLSDPDDPFRGSAAIVDTFTVTAAAQSTLSSATESRFNLPSFALNPQINVRQIPASEFTIFSSTTTSLQIAAAAMPVVGRIHSEGDLVISGAVAALYPVTAGGNISLANNGSLFAQSAPYQPSFRFPVQSTTDDSWLAMARSVGHSTIVSGRDLPMSTFQAADINQMTAPGLNAAAKTPIAQQELWRQCTRIVALNEDQISVTSSSGTPCSSQEASAFFPYHSRNFPNGTVIVFDLSKEPPKSGRNSFYISSSQPAMVLLINGTKLPGDLAIVSPLPVVIEGGFNVLGVARAASITAQRVSGVPPGW